MRNTMLETGALWGTQISYCSTGAMPGFWFIDNLAKVTTRHKRGLTWEEKTSQRLESY